MLNLSDYFAELSDIISEGQSLQVLTELVTLFERQREANGRILLFGNGAAASIASHAALDMTKQGGLTSLCFHDSALLTAFSNDFGYANVYKEIIKHYHQPGDICVFLSVSGESPNIVEAAVHAKALGLFVVGFSGRNENNSLASVSDVSLWANSHAYNIVENAHSSWLLATVDALLGKAVYEVS